MTELSRPVLTSAEHDVLEALHHGHVVRDAGREGHDGARGHPQGLEAKRNMTMGIKIPQSSQHIRRLQGAKGT